MYTITAEGKFLTFQIGSFKIISRQSYFFINNNHKHSSALCGNPLEFLPRENIFFFNYYIATVVDKQKFCWVAKWTWAKSKHVGNKWFQNHREKIRLGENISDLFYVIKQLWHLCPWVTNIQSDKAANSGIYRKRTTLTNANSKPELEYYANILM